MAHWDLGMGTNRPPRYWRSGDPSSGTVAEAGAATDTVAATVRYAGTVAEHGAAADTATTGSTYTVAVTESGAVTDTPTATAAFRPSVAESGAATDAPTAHAAFVSAVSESGSAADTSTESSGAIFGPDPFTSATTKTLVAYNSQYVQEYSAAGDYHQLAAGNNYLSQHVASGGNVVSCWEGTGYPTTDQQVVVDMYSAGSGRTVGVVLRWTSTTAAYVISANGGGAFTVQRAIGGGVVKTFTTALPASTWTTCTISITGTTISVKVGANAAETFTDSTYSSGKVGLLTNANASPYNAWLDNFTLYT